MCIRDSSVGKAGFGVGVNWDGDPNVTLPLGERGNLSFVDGNLEFVLDVTDSARLSIDDDGAEANIALGKNGQLSFDTDGNYDIGYDNKDGTSLLVNQDGAEANFALGKNGQLGFDTDGNYDIGYDNKDGTSLLLSLIHI